MKTEKTLLVEINIMRSMMGLREKSMLITENLIVGLAKAFGKTAARHADDIVKVMDDFISTSAAGGSVAVQRTMATRLKGLLNDLEVAVKAVDDVGINTAIKNILKDPDFGASAATKIADDMFASGDEITIALNNRVKSMRAQGYADDIIKKQLKMDVGAYLDDFPDILKNAAKNKVDTAIDFSGKVVTKTKEEILGNIYAKLDTSQIWSKLKNDEILFLKVKKELDNLVAAGAKSEDEMYTQIIKRADRLMSPSLKSKYRAFFERLPTKYGNEVRMVVNVMIILLLTGGVKAWGPRVKELFNQLGESDVDLIKMGDEIINDAEKEEENKADENTPAGNCDKTDADFRVYLKNERKYTDLDTNTAYGAIVWDQKTCSGSIMDGEFKFKYNMDTKTWSE